MPPCLFLYQSIYLPEYLPAFVYLPVCVPVCLSFCLFIRVPPSIRFVYLSDFLFICLSVCPSQYLYACLFIFSVCLKLSFYLFTYSYFHLYFCSSIFLFHSLFSRLPTCLVLNDQFIILSVLYLRLQYMYLSDRLSVFLCVFILQVYCPFLSSCSFSFFLFSNLSNCLVVNQLVCLSVWLLSACLYDHSFVNLSVYLSHWFFSVYVFISRGSFFVFLFIDLSINLLIWCEKTYLLQI